MLNRCSALFLPRFIRTHGDNGKHSVFYARRGHGKMKFVTKLKANSTPLFLKLCILRDNKEAWFVAITAA